MTIYGYARVSTDGQTLASQDAQLHAAGCAKVYSEKASGARTDRPELAKLLRRLDEGDVLMVTRLDRLARSTRDLLNILDTVAKAGAGFKSLADAWADTTTAHGRLMLTVLGGPCGVRARTDHCSYRRRPCPCQGPWRAFWAPACSDQPPTAGGYPATRGRRYAGRSRADLRCEPSHDIEVAAAPFRARKRGRRIKAKPLGHRQHR